MTDGRDMSRLTTAHMRYSPLTGFMKDVANIIMKHSSQPYTHGLL